MREKSTLRATDESSSKIITEFLQYYFYNESCSNYKEIKDKETQCKGIDCIFDFKGKTYKCDEKAAIRYVNQKLNTYSFELSFINKKGDVMDGWLISDSEENDSYILVWIDKARKNILTDITDIDILTMALVRKELIIQYLADCGWTKERLIAKMNKIRENKNEFLGNKKTPCKFSYTKTNKKGEKVVEEPINVLIPRTKLLEMADFKDVIELAD